MNLFIINLNIFFPPQFSYLFETRCTFCLPFQIDILVCSDVAIIGMSAQTVDILFSFFFLTIPQYSVVYFG